MIEQVDAVVAHLINADPATQRLTAADAAIVKPDQAMVGPQTVDLRLPASSEAACALHQEHDWAALSGLLVGEGDIGEGQVGMGSPLKREMWMSDVNARSALRSVGYAQLGAQGRHRPADGRALL